MSYLGYPRLHFTAGFTANPSTINNTLSNYDVEAPGNNQGQLQVAWNPYGSHAWTLQGGVVNSFVDQAGVLQTSGDPLIGATLANVAKGPPAVLVDLDTDQQGRTQVYGLELELRSAAGTNCVLLQGKFADSGYLANLWFQRVPTDGDPDNAAGGCFQSVLDPRTWVDVSSSPLLQQLQKAGASGLAIRLTTYGFDDDWKSPTFRQGKMVGVIGPWSPAEPQGIAGNRLLGVPLSGGNPASTLWNAPAQIDAGRKVLVLDLGNSIPEQSSGGLPVDLGEIRAALVPASGSPVILGSAGIDYSSTRYLLTAGIAEIPLTDAQLAQAATTPLALLTTSGTGPTVSIGGKTWHIDLQEAANGLYVAIDQASLRMNPGDKTTATLYAWKFGVPAANLSLPLSLQNVQAWNNLPATAIQFNSSVKTGPDGKATIAIGASDPSPKPKQRQNIDGQLYFIGGPWSTTLDMYEMAPLTVKISNSLPAKAKPTWADVQPILLQYYLLYGYMASMVDLSNYTSVKNSASLLKKVLTLPISDPGYMPVTRDLSRDALNMIITWIDQGCAG